MSEVRTGTDALLAGEIRIEGRIMPASNATFFGTVDLTDPDEPPSTDAVRCVYKPVAGERPLWDFPDHSLAGREVAAYAVSEALGWDIVPPTVLRDGPAGVGMVQTWREPDPEQSPVDLVAGDVVPEGYLHVLDAVDDRDRPVSLVHEDSTALRRMAVFDIVTNNADRKGGHVLAMTSGHRHGVDHGVCFHVENKLRTVLWGWLGQPLDPEDVARLEELADQLTTAGSPLLEQLDRLISLNEVRATTGRVSGLLRRRRMPVPSGGWPAIPWPAF